MDIENLISHIIYTVSVFCRAGLIFDGSLVIDPEYRTNDPFIFAAGTVTKYSRKFYADVWQHKYYNSMEVGERVSRKEILFFLRRCIVSFSIKLIFFKLN